MKKTLQSILIGLGMVISAVTSASSATDFDAMLEPVFKINDNCSAVMVKSEEKNGKWVNEALTAFHCVRGNKEGYAQFEVKDRGRLIKEVRATYERLQVDRDGDLAVIRLLDTSQEYPVAYIADEVLVSQGQDTWAVGFPFALEKYITDGMFQGYSHDIAPTLKGDWIRSTATIMNGNSGGPLYQYNGAEDRYEVIGISSALYAQFETSGVFVDLDDIRKLLRLKASTVEFSFDSFIPWDNFRDAR